MTPGLSYWRERLMGFRASWTEWHNEGGTTFFGNPRGQRAVNREGWVVSASGNVMDGEHLFVLPDNCSKVIRLRLEDATVIPIFEARDDRPDITDPTARSDGP